MNYRVFIPSMVLAALLVVSIAYLAHGSQRPRFLLMRGVEPNWEAPPTEATFRIDQRTGEVWKLDAMPVNIGGGKTGQTQVWQKVTEETDAHHRKLMESMMVE